ncbi:MAG: aldehyde dehydrogenase family protein [Deltaproteobacteria bacterium]|nr:aldehyde dehydrogenase family protein [Deltaproteobacteria bacterium]
MKGLFDRLGLSESVSGVGTGTWLQGCGPAVQSVCPIDGQPMGLVRQASEEEYESVVKAAREAFEYWKNLPAPKRGDIIRQIGERVRSRKSDLGALVSLEVGKIRAEGNGEVQEMIDICDFSVGQSRMLYGFTMHSERPGHRMYEQWHPLGPVGVITAFNFPVAVWAWNAMIALAAGNTVIWKPSSKAPLCAVALMNITSEVFKKNGLPDGILNLIVGPRDTIGERLISDRRIPLISATGSVPMGRRIASTVASRLGKTILELGGNNAVIVTPSADLDLAVRAVLFGAVGTAGQRCTTTRRAIVHKDVFEAFSKALEHAYRQVPIGNPLDEGILMGPLIEREALVAMQNALETIERQGGRVLYGGEELSGDAYKGGAYVTPCICEAGPDLPILKEEVFAPILYLIPYETLEEAIHIHNNVPQGLSSAIFTNDLRESERFLSHLGSDCGIANVNVGTSGAEIGGAFGGEKDTGGGRESGSDAWKAYMRRQTNTINWSGELPLAQGIRFEVS